MGIREDLTIDPMNLDQDWANLPVLFHSYSECVEEIDSEMKSEKAKLELLSANTERMIREKPDNYGILKISESAVKAALACNEDLVNIRNEILKLDKEKKVYQAACNSLSYKKDSLKALVTLYGMEYYSAPSTNADGKKFMQKQLDSAVQVGRLKTKDKLNKKKKKKKE